MRTQTREAKNSLTPDKASQILKQDNQRFINNLEADRNLLHEAKHS